MSSLDENIVITETYAPESLTKDLNITESVKSWGSSLSSWGSWDAWDKTTIIKVLVIFVILAFLGFNLFTYLGDILEKMREIFSPLIDAISKFFGYTVGETVKQTVKTSAEGTKGGIDIAAGTVESGINVLERGVGSKPEKPKQSGPSKHMFEIPQAASEHDDSLNKALADAENRDPEPDDATSVTQRNGKSGHCYIGEDRGFRSCIRVGENDTCMSGEIFPTQAICINPNLRE